ncbi:MAG: Holliday junction branch migration DNA helicase RuvB [Planctomycetota bacterium]|jgi:Holliday junction DNA helicase RuvB
MAKAAPVFDPGRSDEEEARFEQEIRPDSFSEFVGQERILTNLKTYIAAARKRGEKVLDHILFSGPPGMGKTTLSRIVAREMGGTLSSTSGPVLDRPTDLAGILTKMGEGDFLFIDEIHRMNKAVMEYVYSAMEDFCIDIVLDQGPAARSVKLNLKPFTLVGATTREGILTAPFRERFQIRERLDPYPPPELARILVRSAKIIGIRITDEAAGLIATRARGTPRVANRFLRRIRDLAQVRGKDVISPEIGDEGLRMLGVDIHGLEEMDRRVLRVLLQNKGRPVGLKTIAVAVDEEEDTIESVYEPYLVRMGFMVKTPQGRLATDRASEALQESGDTSPSQGHLF